MPAPFTQPTFTNSGNLRVEFRRLGADEVQVWYDEGANTSVLTAPADRLLQTYRLEVGRVQAGTWTSGVDLDGCAQRTSEELERRRAAEQEELQRRQAADLADWDRRLAEQRKRNEEARRLLEEARVKSKETLLRMLTDKQRKQVKRYGWFRVVGSCGNTYEIDVEGGYEGNIQLVKHGKRTAGFCCHPNPYGSALDGSLGRLPEFDAFLAQKLMIETNEVDFLRVTVCNRGRRPDVGFKHVEVEPYAERRCICNDCESGRYEASQSLVDW